jgi:hypothetical protein
MLKNLIDTLIKPTERLKGSTGIIQIEKADLIKSMF